MDNRHILKHLTLEAVCDYANLTAHSSHTTYVKLSNQYFTLMSTIERLFYLDTLSPVYTYLALHQFI